MCRVNTDMTGGANYYSIVASRAALRDVGQSSKCRMGR